MIEINDDDISTVESELKVKFDDTRKQIIKTFDDVQACPGSGKTTMVAAKLLIIAKKWKYSHQGVCVLTHTNVAKREIIDRLENDCNGQNLLSYPHFIGTIQEFVNKFLAIPYLRSMGYSINQVDDEVCSTKGWYLLSRGTRTYLERKRITSLYGMEYKLVNGELELIVPAFKITSTSKSYKDLVYVKEQLMGDGYFYYHEMYEFAKYYIQKNPIIKEAIQSRFPLVFIDEMQDTQKFQDELLNDLFKHENVEFQKFGDPDQAIYSSKEEENQTYNQIILEKVEDSHRFNHSVALLAKNLSYNRINLNSKAAAPEQTSHTIFLVDEHSRKTVFNKFAELCMDVVPEDCKKPIKSIGAVGIRKDDGLTICDYLESFDKGNSAAAFKPNKLIHYIYEGRRLKTRHESYRQILNGIVRLGRIANDEIVHIDGVGSPFSAMNIRKYLKESGLNIEFNILIKSLIEDVITESVWGLAITNLLRGFGISQSRQLEEFISFECDSEVAGVIKHSKSSNTVYAEISGRVIENEVATIHSVKGETHAATLVLETKYRSCDLMLLIDYILGENTTIPTAVTKIKFMKQLYVAFSRPEHLLCLAMHKSGFPQEHLGKQDYAGWKICDLTVL